ncbi:group 1 glycosyl transferase [Chroococcidiopsis sp. CCALA 051]|uniref:glycosyltransferase family 4 protein n=1 Tax=Chroococcidiopsis sp. CCALA 051 TaxID=869949 RepID=UPI000D0DDC0C|nr:glycosyltransferase family 4 protein [Chroococcidiopsis sp. CCALA 051]PSM45981.1 group 1 glycosyl transferase [Chroococcidiopsis sp. CCALA 051]
MTTIAIIAGTYQPDRCGTAHYTAYLRQALAKQGVNSIVLTTQAAATAIDDPNVKGVVTDWGLSQILSLVRAVKSTAADLLHIQHAAGTYRFQRPIFLLPLLLRVFGYRKPIVTTVHEYGWWEWQPKGIPPQFLEWLKMWGQQRGWWDREDGFLLTRSDAIITTNAEAESVILKRMPNSTDRLHRIAIAANITVVPIDRQQARQQLRQQFAWLSDSFVVVFFGFLHPVKGIEYLLSAFRQVVTQQPQARLLLLGGVESLALQAEAAKSYWDRLQLLVKELHLSDRVSMTGYVSGETASHYLSGADLGVLPFNHGVTLKSGSLLALMAHGLPVIATRSTPPDPDLLAENLLELIPTRNDTALTEALLKLIPDRAKCDRLSATASTLSDRFTWSAIAKAHNNIYQQLLTTKKQNSK